MRDFRRNRLFEALISASCAIACGSGGDTASELSSQSAPELRNADDAEDISLPSEIASIEQSEEPLSEAQFVAAVRYYCRECHRSPDIYNNLDEFLAYSTGPDPWDTENVLELFIEQGVIVPGDSESSLLFTRNLMTQAHLAVESETIEERIPSPQMVEQISSFVDAL